MGFDVPLDGGEGGDGEVGSSGGGMGLERGLRGLIAGGVGRWRSMRGGVSEVFDLPGLPGVARKRSEEV